MPTTYGAFDFVTKKGDTEPALEATLEDANGNAKDLTNADSVQFHMKDPTADTAKVDKAATIDDAANGEVSYSWDGEDVDTTGEYEAEFEVSWSDGDTETFPKDGYLDLKILDTLA
jgi:hypothetical protein